MNWQLHIKPNQIVSIMEVLIDFKQLIKINRKCIRNNSRCGNEGAATEHVTLWS